METHSYLPQALACLAAGVIAVLFLVVQGFSFFAVVRVLDKLFRIATDRDALGESPWRDIAGYGLLGARRVEAQRTSKG